MVFGNPPTDPSSWGRFMRPRGHVFDPKHPSDGLLEGELLIKVNKRSTVCECLLTLPHRLRMRFYFRLQLPRRRVQLLEREGAGDMGPSASQRATSLLR
jgi:hypothetical protein